MDVKERELKLLITEDGNCPFEDWIRSLRDRKTIAIIQNRLYRAEDGNFGDWKTLEAGVMEMRIDYGPGYRVYFVLHQDSLIVLLAGGDKSTQEKDVQRAVALWKENQDETERFRRDF